MKTAKENKMSQRVLAIIRIGGRLAESQAPKLIAAINNAEVFSHRGDVHFQPSTTADLAAARTPAGFLELTDDEAAWGDMPGIVAVCRELELPYRLWSECSAEFGSEVKVWAPGMERAAVYRGDHTDSESILVDVEHVAAALTALEVGKVEAAVEALEEMLPEVPEMPVFEVVNAAPVVMIEVPAHVQP